MIHNLSKCLLLTTVAILLLGCEKEKSETFADLIIGKWEWVESVSSWTGLVKNPQTEGYSQTLEFSTNGMMKWYQNNVLMDSTNYIIEEYSTEPSKYELVYGQDLRTHVHFVEDSLFLNSAYVDGPFSSYVRIE